MITAADAPNVSHGREAALAKAASLLRAAGFNLSQSRVG